jgi:hypothetical protein
MPTTLLLPRERDEWYRDHDGVWCTHKHKDEVLNYSIDWQEVLPSGASISSATWTASGVTVSGDAISGTTTSADITGTDGSVELKIVSSGKTYIKQLRFRGVPQGGDSRDYPL